MNQQDRQAWTKRARYVYSLRLIQEGRHQEVPQRLVCRSPRDAFAIMAPIAAVEPAEVFWILPLDSQHRMIGRGPIVITRGTLNSSLVHPRETFRAAIVAGAAAIILSHNHPSGDPTPSADDRAVTDQLVAAGRLLDLPVVDHIVVGMNRYTSFAEAGLL